MKIACHPLQTEFPFVADLPEQSSSIADYSIPERVLREVTVLADRKGAKASAAIEDILFRECGETLGSVARRAIAAGFLAERAERQQAFLEGLGLRRNEESPDGYATGTWSISQGWAATGPIFTIAGIRDAAGGSISVRLGAREFHRAASVMTAIIRVIDPGDYAKPSPEEWRRIWHGGSQNEAGLMAQLLAGLNTGSSAGDERLLRTEGVQFG